MQVQKQELTAALKSAELGFKAQLDQLKMDSSLETRNMTDKFAADLRTLTDSLNQQTLKARQIESAYKIADLALTESLKSQKTALDQ